MGFNIHPHHDDPKYTVIEDKLLGVVAIGKKQGTKFIIYNFESHKKRQGHTKTFLRNLRRKFSRIEVRNAGDLRDPDAWAFRYWVHMLNQGFVDRVLDDNNKVVKRSRDYTRSRGN